MGLISLNIGDITETLQMPEPAQSPATHQPFQETEMGGTGTPIFGGFLRELGEYNPELTGLEAISTYERMRRSDAQVAATLMACKLPIRGAEWTVQEPRDASPVEKEATELVKSCMFQELDFDGVLENALLMLDFGCAVHEEVYYIDGNQVRLKKLAARLPITFYRWITAPNGDDLVALQQQGYRGADYLYSIIPANKIALFTYQQEGSNYTGRSLLRPMYQHWYIKSKLYKIEAIACERNGMGVPAMSMGTDSKKEDRDEAKTWLQGLAVSEATSILMPNGWTFSLEGVKGTVHSSKDAIEHHNTMISMAALSAFINLGQGSKGGGSHALGQTMSDFFYLSLQATANQIARVINLSTVKRLVDLNFTGIVNYPSIVPQQILAVKMEGIIDALGKLAGGNVDLIQPDDDLEGWMRKKMGMPDAKNPRPPVAAKGGGAGSPAANASFSESFRPSRPPRGAEKFLALSEMSSALDKGRDEIAIALRAARPRIQAEVIQKLMSQPVKNAHRVSVEIDSKLVAEVENILEGVYSYGSQTVADERLRQHVGKAPATAAKVRAAVKRDPLGVYADGVVSEVTNNIQQRAANVVIDLKRRADRTPGQMVLDAAAKLDDQSDGWIDNAAAKGANEAFADGRADGYEEHRDEIASVVYSALLDMNTCPQCADADGEEGETPDDIPAVPNPDCDGGDKCRCVHVYVFADEQRAAA